MVALAVVYVAARVSGRLPVIALAAVWTLLAAATSLAFAYPRVVKKMHDRRMYLSGSFVHRFVSGRFLVFLLSLLFSAILMAGLTIDMQRWGASEWLMAGIAVLLYPLLASLVERSSKQTFEEAFQERGSMLWSWGVAGLATTLVYLAVLFLFPAHAPATLGETFSSTQQLWVNSPSVLLAEGGKLEYFLQAMTTFGLGQIEGGLPEMYLVICIVLCATAAFALAHLLSFCSMTLGEIKFVFLPYPEDRGSGHTAGKTVKHAALFAALCLVLCFAFIGANGMAARFSQSGTYEGVIGTLRNSVQITAYEFDGKNYPDATVNRAFETGLEANPGLQQTHATLKDEVNAYYDTCQNNVDAYLEWYNGIVAYLERIGNTLSGSYDQFVEDEYRSRITSGTNAGAFEADVAAYNSAVESLRSSVEDSLAKDGSYGIPDWLVSQKLTLDQLPALTHLDASLPLHEPDRRDFDNRDNIVAAIEQSRSEALAMIGADEE